MQLLEMSLKSYCPVLMKKLDLGNESVHKFDAFLCFGSLFFGLGLNIIDLKGSY